MNKTNLLQESLQYPLVLFKPNSHIFAHPSRLESISIANPNKKIHLQYDSNMITITILAGYYMLYGIIAVRTHHDWMCSSVFTASYLLRMVTYMCTLMYKHRSMRQCEKTSTWSVGIVQLAYIETINGLLLL